MNLRTIFISFMVLGSLFVIMLTLLAQETPEHPGRERQSETKRRESSSQASRTKKTPVYITDEELHAFGGVPKGWSFTLPEGNPRAGRQVFIEMECFKCHAITNEDFPPVNRSTGEVGPDLTGMGSRHPAEYIAESIINPNAVIITGPGYTGSDGLSIMPTYNDVLTLHQLIDLVAYLKNLDKGQRDHLENSSQHGAGDHSPQTHKAQEQTQIPPKTPSSSNQEGRVFNIEIKNRKISGNSNVIRVKQGDRVTFKWTTDEPFTLHLHGYDIEKELKPGEVTTFSFKAHATGRFPITSHGFHHPTLGERKPTHPDQEEEIILLYLEVLP
jgi:mono/diheme cytochrome c family protein